VVFWAQFLVGFANILHLMIRFYIWIILFRAILSWFPAPSLGRFLVILYRLTEPALKPLRKLLPPYRVGGLDISPMLAILVLLALDTLVVRSLLVYARHLMRPEIWSF